MGHAAGTGLGAGRAGSSAPVRVHKAVQQRPLAASRAVDVHADAALLPSSAVCGVGGTGCANTLGHSDHGGVLGPT